MWASKSRWGTWSELCDNILMEQKLFLNHFFFRITIYRTQFNTMTKHSRRIHRIHRTSKKYEYISKMPRCKRRGKRLLGSNGNWSRLCDGVNCDGKPCTSVANTAQNSNGDSFCYVHSGDTIRQKLAKAAKRNRIVCFCQHSECTTKIPAPSYTYCIKHGGKTCAFNGCHWVAPQCSNMCASHATVSSVAAI